MDSKSWIMSNCRFAKELERASPHLTLENPETGEQTPFDAGVECLTKPCVPENWTSTEEAWQAYAKFLLEFYGTDDWTTIHKKLSTDEIVPVWTGGGVEFVCRGDDGIHRPCDQRERNHESGQDLEVRENT